LSFVIDVEETRNNHMGSFPALDIDLLRSFVLIAEGGSFTRVAERVGRTQSAVSLQVQRLESLVGHRVLIRGKGGLVQLTTQGQYLLDRARDLIALNDDIVGSLRAQPQEPEPKAPSSDAAAPAVAVVPRQSGARPSIAVMPFQNLTGDGEQDYFADGMTGNIITGLSHITWISVVAYGSTLVHKGAVDVREVGRKLGVRYVLEGGVYKTGHRVRISVRMLDAETGALLWADKFDGGLVDLFDLQDQISEHILGVIEPSLQRSEIERALRKRPESLDAYDLYLRALPHVVAQMPHEAKKAVALLDRALKLDPDYAAAHALLGWCHELCFTRGGFDAADKDAAILHARASIAGNTDDVTALAIGGFAIAMCIRDEQEAGLAAIDRAIELNASCTTALHLGAQAHSLAGHWGVAAALADRALKMSPLDPLAFQSHLALGHAALGEERYEDASACFGRAAQRNPGFSSSYLNQAMALAVAGRGQDARPMARRGLELEPGYRVRALYESKTSPGLVEKFIGGARLLGLPA
jgi:TolB-like protein/tetratricopeptide (TPR) repeat protein